MWPDLQLGLPGHIKIRFNSSVLIINFRITGKQITKIGQTESVKSLQYSKTCFCSFPEIFYTVRCVELWRVIMGDFLSWWSTIFRSGKCSVGIIHRMTSRNHFTGSLAKVLSGNLFHFSCPYYVSFCFRQVFGEKILSHC